MKTKTTLVEYLETKIRVEIKGELFICVALHQQHGKGIPVAITDDDDDDDGIRSPSV